MHIEAMAFYRRAIWERDGGICGICTLPVELDAMDLDHIEPRSKGGKDTFENLRPAHARCNRARCSDVAYVLPGDVPSRPRILRRAAPYIARPVDENALLPLGTVAAALGYSEAGLKRLVKQGLIPCHDELYYGNIKRLYRVSEVRVAMEDLASCPPS